MPVYSNTVPAYSVAQGGQITIVNAELLGAGINSQRVSVVDRSTGVLRPITITFNYSAAPAAVQYDVYVGWDDTLGFPGYTKIGSTANVAGDQVTLQRDGAGQVNFRFVLVREVISPAGQTATVVVRQ